MYIVVLYTWHCALTPRPAAANLSIYVSIYHSGLGKNTQIDFLSRVSPSLRHIFVFSLLVASVIHVVVLSAFAEWRTHTNEYLMVWQILSLCTKNRLIILLCVECWVYIARIIITIRIYASRYFLLLGIRYITFNIKHINERVVPLSSTRMDCRTKYNTLDRFNNAKFILFFRK